MLYKFVYKLKNVDLVQYYTEPPTTSIGVVGGSEVYKNVVSFILI